MAAAPRRRGRLVAVLVAAVVVVAAVVTTVVLLRRNDDQQTAAEFVGDYLDALAHGSAADVLAHGPAPTDATFLTDAALHAQQQLAPITDVSTDARGSSTVEARYTFGTQAVRTSFDVSGSAGHWRLAQTWAAVSFVNAPADTTLFGRPVGSRGPVLVFPGPLAFATSSTFLGVRADPPFPEAPGNDQVVHLAVTVTTAGQTAAQRAVQTELTACAQVRDLAPDQCPQKTFPNLSAGENLVAESIHWTAPSDLSHLQYRLDGTDIDVVGPVYFGVSYDVESAAAGTQTRTERVLTDLNGTVDLTADPPKYVS